VRGDQAKGDHARGIANFQWRDYRDHALTPVNNAKELPPGTVHGGINYIRINLCLLIPSHERNSEVTQVE
jgi:hypothetical protein